MIAVVIGAGPRASAFNSEELRGAMEALNAWDVVQAESYMADLEGDDPEHPGVLLAKGRLELMQGRYDEAARHLAAAADAGAGPMATDLALVARNTAEETRDYVEHVTSGGNFVIRHAPGVDEVLVPYADEALEAAWRNLTELFDYRPPTPIRVEIYPRVEVLGAVSSLTVEEIRTSGTIALCKYNRLMIVSPRDLVYGYGWTSTLAHEFIHLLITKKSGNTVPIWLHEGLAKYYEARGEDDGKPTLSRHSEDLLARALADGTLISFEDMSPSIAKLPSQESASTAFAEVHTVIAFLVERRGKDVSDELVDLMRKGYSDRDAVAKVAGLSWSRFEPAWRSYLQRRGLRTLKDAFDQRLLFKGQNAETEDLQTLKGAQGRDHVWLGDRMTIKERIPAALKEYRRAAAAVGDKTPIVQRKIGHALLRLSRVDEAIDELRKPLDIYPGQVLLHVYLGEAYLRNEDFDKAREHLELATRINPFDPDVHGYLAKVYRALGENELAQREQRFHRLVNER